jgi:hypothetical protein
VGIKGARVLRFLTERAGDRASAGAELPLPVRASNRRLRLPRVSERPVDHVFVTIIDRLVDEQYELRVLA